MSEYDLEFRPTAYRTFGKLDPTVKRRLAPAIDGLRSDPRPPGCRLLAGTDDLWRIRVGAYRVVYTIREERLVVVVVRLGPRRSVYRGL